MQQSGVSGPESITVLGPDIPTKVRGLRYACPTCRKPVSGEETLDGWHCTTCGFQVSRRRGIFCFTRTDMNEWQQFFEDKAAGPGGNTVAGCEYHTSAQYRYIVDAFRRMCGDLRDDAIVLDAGCGNGLFWREFLAPRPVVGIDYSRQMCALAEAKGMTAHQANILELPFADGQFDLIYSAEILQYITDLPALLAEFARVCRSGGRIVVSTVNRNSLLLRSLRGTRAFFPRKDMPLSFRYITRTADEIVESAFGLPLSLHTVGWSHFPFPWLRRSKSQKRAMDWLASNVFVEFAKLAP